MPRAAKIKTTDAISLLKSDHRKVEGLFERYEKSRSKSVKAKLAREICLELSVHTTIEEELFYPAIKETVDEEIYNEAYVEHDGAKVLIAEILAGTPDDDFYDAKVKVLSEMIKHHVKEEEQRGGHVRSGQGRRRRRPGGARNRHAGPQERARGENEKRGVPTPATRSMKGAVLDRRSAGRVAAPLSALPDYRGFHGPHPSRKSTAKSASPKTRLRTAVKPTSKSPTARQRPPT